MDALITATCDEVLKAFFQELPSSLELGYASNLLVQALKVRGFGHIERKDQAIGFARSETSQNRMPSKE